MPRLAFGDCRQRHTGISHHSITVLRDIIQYSSSGIAFDGCKRRIRIMEQLEENGLRDKHRIIFVDGVGIQRALNHYNYIPPLWQGVNEEPFFLCVELQMVWFKKYFTALV